VNKPEPVYHADWGIHADKRPRSPNPQHAIRLLPTVRIEPVYGGGGGVPCKTAKSYTEFKAH